jgi:hypothetical protein
MTMILITIASRPDRAASERRARGLKGALLAVVVGGFMAVAALDVFAGVDAAAPEGVELLLVHDGAAVQLSSDLSKRLTTRFMSYFEECLTYEAVVFGERPPQKDLRDSWAEQERGNHALVRLPAGDYGRHSFDHPTTLIIGFSSSGGAWPVMTRTGDDDIVFYTKCSGLDGLVLACDVSEAVPGIAVPSDCDRLREIKRRTPHGRDGTHGKEEKRPSEP